MICGFCNREFEEDRGQPGCQACPLGSDCGLVRCPHCGFENPATPRVVAFLAGVFGRRKETSAPRRRGRPLPILPTRPPGEDR